MEKPEIKSEPEQDNTIETLADSKEGITIVENKELGVSYRQSYEELPLEKQEETGIKRLRKIDVLSYPDELYSNTRRGLRNAEGFVIYGQEPIWHFLTDGRFPSYKTWNHIMSADWANTEGAAMIREFNEKQGIFDEYFPPQNSSFGIFFNITEKDIEEVTDRNKLTPQERRDGLSFFPMDVMDQGEVWESCISGPVFAFGGKNKVFIDYINSISDNPQTKEMLEMVGFAVDSPLELITKDSPDFEKYKRLFRGHDAIVRPKIDFPPEYLSDEWDPYAKHPPEITQAIRAAERSGSAKNISSCKFLFEEIDVKYYQGQPPGIPVVRHPDIKPLRWSHAELAVIPKGKDLEIIFFEQE